MALKLTEIQDLVRDYLADEDFPLISGEGLRFAKTYYNALLTPGYRVFGRKVGRRWPEAQRENTDITLTASTARYDWPTDPIFKDEPLIEILDSQGDVRDVVEPPANMDEWSRWDVSGNGLPRVYRRLYVSSRVQIEFRPTPDQTGETVRISGVIVPQDFEDGESRTIFLDPTADHALAALIASRILSKRETPGPQKCWRRRFPCSRCTTSTLAIRGAAR